MMSKKKKPESRLGSVQSFFGGPVSTRVLCAIEKPDPEVPAEPVRKAKKGSSASTAPALGPLGSKKNPTKGAPPLAENKHIQKKKRLAARDFGDLDEDGDVKIKPRLPPKQPMMKKRASAQPAARPKAKAPPMSVPNPRNRKLPPPSRAPSAAPAARLQQSAAPAARMQQSTPSQARMPQQQMQQRASTSGQARPQQNAMRPGVRQGGLPLAQRPPQRPPQRAPAYGYGYEDEYDEELDDFIVDDEDETAAAFRALRGMTRYEGFHDEGDDRSMVASAADIAREEARSARMGAMDDQEDIEREKQMKLDKKRRKEVFLAAQRRR